ncbi:MAG: hypothetical protein ACK2TV_06050 [Anaerolineales bacterium]
MTFPAIVFSFFIATMLGSFLHLWRGGGFFKLILYLVLSWIGFFGGHLLAESFSINFLNLGSIHLGMGILGSIVLLSLGYWLSLVDFQNT